MNWHKKITESIYKAPYTLLDIVSDLEKNIDERLDTYKIKLNELFKTTEEKVEQVLVNAKVEKELEQRFQNDKLNAMKKMREQSESSVLKLQQGTKVKINEMRNNADNFIGRVNEFYGVLREKVKQCVDDNMNLAALPFKLKDQVNPLYDNFVKLLNETKTKVLSFKKKSAEVTNDFQINLKGLEEKINRRANDTVEKYRRLVNRRQ